MQAAPPPCGSACALWQPSSSTHTTSPGRTSRTTSAPTRSSAHVSDATTQSSPMRPSVSGRMPSGSRNATSTPSAIATTEYAPASRRIVAATASGSGAGLAREERRDHLGVGRRRELHARCEELVAERLGLDEVAVVPERDRPLGAVVDDRLGVRPVDAARSSSSACARSRPRRAAPRASPRRTPAARGPSRAGR